MHDRADTNITGLFAPAISGVKTRATRDISPRLCHHPSFAQRLLLTFGSDVPRACFHAVTTHRFELSCPTEHLVILFLC